MRTPGVFDRVRVSGQDGDFMVVRVDSLARVADPFALVDLTIETNLSFILLSPPREPAGIDADFSIHDGRLAVARDVLRSTYAHLNRSNHAIADLRDSIESTLCAIRTSQQLIAESDGIIARAHCNTSIHFHP
jgi:hypothetical protein